MSNPPTTSAADARTDAGARRRQWRKWIALAIPATLVLLLAGHVARRMRETDPCQAYSFRMTRELVARVLAARELLEERGVDAFPQLEGMKSERFGLYLYLYRRDDAMCLYHGENPDLVGTRLDLFGDQMGKQPHRLIVNELDNPCNPHGWIHYYWHRPRGLFLEWKSSCHQAVTMPDGTACYVGGGLYGIGAEPEFARIAVRTADHLLRTRGKAALPELLDPTGPFFFHDTAVFVLHEDGMSIIDPVFKRRRRCDVREFRDAVGHEPFTHLLRTLSQDDEAQVILYAHSPFSMNLQKKTIHARNSLMGTTPVIVGTVIDSPHSVWQR